MPTRKYHPRGEKVHGFSVKKHPLYNTWILIRQRCLNKNNHAYDHYGGRGITICDRWQSFRNFAIDMGLKPSNDHSVDRIDNDLGYFPENCRWATVSEQRFNRRVFSNSSTGFAGVQPNGRGSFTSMVHINNTRHHLGTFKTVEEAVNARQKFIACETGTVEG